VLDEGEGSIERTLRGMVRRLGEPVIRTAVAAAMREMGEQFVLGRTISEALKRGKPMLDKGYLYSYDMLGEAARTEADALRYLKAYADAIAALKPHAKGDDIRRNPGISVKLSAIHPRYEVSQRETMLPVMSERLLSLALAAKDARMGLNIDAEEADRLDLSLDVIESVLSDERLAGWDGFGIVVQAYGPRCAFAIDWLYELAKKLDRRIMVRLVKGAYWDTEIKRAQVLGLPGYPVFTRKTNTGRASYSVIPTASIRNSPPTTPIPFPPYWRWRPTAIASNCSACMEWASSFMRPCERRKAPERGFMRRWARIPICLPISCAACWRTAPIPLSCIN
jgi:RHH-type proline utilization regulon transcriptional repressor/proline dehydrogenase/delta 1-pyrroline-5-carboxylate dehydrogenase